MPIYFFDTRDNDEYVEDDVGIDLPHIDAVKVEAAKGLAELAHEVLPGNLRRNLAVEVRDHRGPVMKALLSFEAVILRTE